MFKNILLPTDGSKGVIKALNCAVAIALQFGAKIHVLFVIEPPVFIFDHQGFSSLAVNKVIENLREAGERIVEKTAKLIRKAGVEDVEVAVREGSPAQTVLQYAKKKKIDLIVMGTHGRRGLNRILLGSVAEEVVRTSDVPVMTVRMMHKERKKR